MLRAFWYWIAPHPLTTAGFESVFPILAWQLLFVHGLAIGYHRERVSAFVARLPRAASIAGAGVCAALMVFALCNPWAGGPSWLHLGVISPERFTYLYGHFFGLTDLGIGRVLNLAIGLPFGYAVLTWGWRMASPLGIVFVTLGQRSLGAFVLHVYGILLLAALPRGRVLDQHAGTDPPHRRDRCCAERRSACGSRSAYDDAAPARPHWPLEERSRTRPARAERRRSTA
jgi:hypothetical protein